MRVLIHTLPGGTTAMRVKLLVAEDRQVIPPRWIPSAKASDAGG